MINMTGANQASAAGTVMPVSAAAKASVVVPKATGCRSLGGAASTTRAPRPPARRCCGRGPPEARDRQGQDEWLDVDHDEPQVLPPAAPWAVEPALGRRRSVRDRTSEQVEGHYGDDGQRQQRQTGVRGHHDRQRGSSHRRDVDDQELTAAGPRCDQLVADPSQDARWRRHGFHTQGAGTGRCPSPAAGGPGLAFGSGGVVQRLPRVCRATVTHNCLLRLHDVALGRGASGAPHRLRRTMPVAIAATTRMAMTKIVSTAGSMWPPSSIGTSITCSPVPRRLSSTPQANVTGLKRRRRG